MKKEVTKSDIYAIYYLMDNGRQPKEISKELSIGIKLVNDAIGKRETQKNSSIPTTSSKVTSKDLMIRETMTKEASEVHDAFRKNIDTAVSRTAKNAIYRPNSNKK